MRSLPNDFALQPARTFITAALRQIHEVEVKRNRREQTQIANQKAEEDRNAKIAQGIPYWMPTHAAKRAVDELDKMIQQELNSFRTKPQKKQNDDFQTFYG